MENSIFTAEPEASTEQTQAKPWHILVVDDEEGVHQVTDMVLRSFKFDGRPLKISSVYSAGEAKAFMEENHDVAMAIVDVVMEHDSAGLELVRYIRSELNNHFTRLVLRTGQPGSAPEEDVIIEYDIDDYKDKTELTSNKLVTLMYATLRSYRDICTLDEHRQSLEHVILASTEIFEASSLTGFANAVLKQICSLLNLSGAIFYCTSINSEVQDKDHIKVLAASGSMKPFQTERTDDLPKRVLAAFDEARTEKHTVITDETYVGYFATGHGSENLLYVSMEHPLSELDRQLLDIYGNNVAITYENLLLGDEIIESQKELVYLLGEAVEQRSKETGSHVRRVALFSHILATKYGLSPEEAETIKLASPLHDVGKISIPDRILKKPGKLTAEEWAIMQTHAQAGSDMLGESDNDVIQMGRIIAAQHHERWEGGGYPSNLKGEEIHIAGRITAVADVFDALGCKRCYKDAWPLTKVLEEIDSQKGKQFDPTLVEILHDNIHEFIAVQSMYPD